MSHLLVSSLASMHRFALLLFILGLGQSIYAASIFQFPDLTRRIPERPPSPGCAYKGERYEHGDSVPTAEPCLNCTCIRAVLVCYLRVCPTASAPPPGCFAAREMGECCPKLHCRGAELPRPTNTSDPNIDLRPTFRPSPEQTSEDYSTKLTSEAYGSSTDSIYLNWNGINDVDNGGSTTFIKDGTTISDKDGAVPIQDEGTTNVETSKDNTTTDESFESTQYSENSPTDTYLTVSGTTFLPDEDDSLVYVSSTPKQTPDYDMTFFNDIPAGGCMVNGTLYGDGSAMLSSTFCEYCFCIRGKSTCLKPKCHLTIEGCTPHYDDHYTCCPSRYECSQNASLGEIDDNPTTLSSTTVDTTQSLGDTIDCFVNGTVYQQGALIPNHKLCHNCYCNSSSVLCEKIKCSPALEGCTPIIPQGYCCPISYRCDYERTHLASNSIKGSNLNDTFVSVDNKGSDIKSVNNYYVYSNENVRAKTPIDRESIPLLQNVILRRLDENSNSEEASTVKSVNNESRIQIGYGAQSDSDKNVKKDTYFIRENDKTLKLEQNDTASEPFPMEERTFADDSKPFNRAMNSHDEVSNVETVTLDSPIEHVLTIQELFDQFFGRQNPNNLKVPPETSLEPKRNNSKQPSSIVEIYELDDNNTKSTPKNPIPTYIQTTEKDSKITNENLDLNTEAGDPKNQSFISNFDATTNNSDSFPDNTNRRITKIPDVIYNQEKIQSKIPSLLFSTAKNRNPGDFHTFPTTEPIYPIFISTLNKDSEDQSETNAYAEVKALTTKESFDNQDILETSSSSHIETTIDNLFNLKSESFPETHPIFAVTDSENLYREESKQTRRTSLDYSTTKAGLIEELKSQTQTRPVVFIYDIMKNDKATQSISSMHDTTRFSFPASPIDYSDGQPTALWHETTKFPMADDSVDHTDASELSSTVEDIYNVLKNHGSIFSVSPVHIVATNQNNGISTKTHQPNIHFVDTTKTKNKVRTSPSQILFMTTPEYTNNYEQTENIPSSIHTTLKENIKSDDQTKIQSLPSHTGTKIQYNIITEQTLVPFTHTTKTNVENRDKLLDKETRPAFDAETTKNINIKDFQNNTGIQNISPSLVNNKYQEDANQEQTLKTFSNSKISLTTTISDDERLSETESFSPTETTFPTTETQEKDYSVDAVLQTKINAHKDTTTTEVSRISTRINSKLPSFNNVDIIDKIYSNASYSNYPVLTDSFINAYIPGEGINNYPDSEKEGFVNIGSIYLGAPLAVGGTDSRIGVDDGKLKVTQSEGVIFLDPKLTDIATKTDIESKETLQKDTTSANTEKQASAEKADSSNDRKKGLRNQAQSKAGQGFQIIPFVAEDAVRNQFGKINETFAMQPGVTEGPPDIVSDFCFIKGRIYMNGEVIGKFDPCELCRCFYGRELCQIQRCPTAPPGCVPDKVPGFCCPRFTCGNNATFNEEMKLVGIVLPPETPTSTTRKPDIMDRKPQINDKQEMKFGIRVRVRPSPTPYARTSEYATETKTTLDETTFKPEIQTNFNKLSATTTSVLTPKTSETKTTTITTKMMTTATPSPSPLFPDPWGLLKVSGCNIYGKFFNINDQVEILSGPCSHCICTTNGVECNDIC